MRIRNIMRAASGVVLAGLLAVSAGVLSAQEMYRLVSAQVVASTDRPPTLKLSANGPIAFSVQAAAQGTPAAPNRVSARLYGVAPGDLASTGLAPFSVTFQGEGHDTILTVVGAAGHRLELRSAKQSNEIEVVVMEIGQ